MSSSLQRSITFTFVFCVLLGQAPLSYAQIVADPNAGAYRPDVTTPPNTNNVPVVNITGPSNAGVSRNQYQQFDVQQQGVILNNNATNSNTQLAGWIQGNANFAPGQSARIILNEVTSGNPSMLQGYIEVAGNRAEVIVANPAGIAVSGGGFINATSATLTTGKPIFAASGHLEAFRVGGNNARIQINGAFDTSTVDYTRIIARAVEINSGLWAKDLTVAAGTGDFAPNGAPIQLTVEDEAGKPLFAIDVAQLGGMYAGKIHLIGTESGVGVRNAGHIGASVGQVAVTADGRLVNTGAINAQSQINLQAREIHNSNTIYSQGTLTASADNMINAGIIAAQNDLSLQAQTIENTEDALIAAGIDTEGRLTGTGSLNLEATQTLHNRGDIVATDTLTAKATTLINDSRAQLAAATTQIQSSELTNRGLIDGATTHIKAQELTNIGTGRIYGDHLALEGGRITNTSETIGGQKQAATIAARDRLDIGVGELYNQDHALIYSGGNLFIAGALDVSTLTATGEATLVQNDGGTIEAVGDLAIAAVQIQNLNTTYEDAIVAQDSKNVFDHVVGSSVINNEEVLFFKEDGSSDYTVGGWFTTNTLWEAKDRLGGSSNWFMLRPSSIYTQEQTLAIFRLGGLRSLPNNARADYQPGGRYYSAWSILGIEAPQAGDSADLTNQKFNALQSQVWRFRNDIENRKVSQETMRQYVETHYRTEVTQTNPGEIIAGGNIHLTGDILNDKSRILAGGSITTVGNLQNIAALGEDYITRSGTQINTSRTASGRSWSGQADFNQKTGESIIDLGITESTENAAINSTNPDMDGVILTTPGSSLYEIHPGADKNYLIETDPRFANYGKWLSSDYMLSELGLIGDLSYKRLGDGFYEQQLIREQIGRLTGYRFLAGYQSDEEQYMALMSAGAEFAQEYKLSVGLALSAEQMAQLTTDIVWLVSRDVMLPDGSIETVLVPQVYTASGASLINTDGTMISANNVYLGGQDNTLTNRATIAARGNLVADMGDIQNLAGGQLHGNNTVLQAENNIENIGGVITAYNEIQMIAGGDIIHASTVTEGADQHGSMSNIGNTGLIYLAGNEGTSEEASSGNIYMQAGRDIRVEGAAIINDSTPAEQPEAAARSTGNINNTSGSTTLVAGNDIYIGTVTTEAHHNVTFDGKNSLGLNSIDEHGSQMLTAGDINLIADNNLTIRGSELESGDGAINAVVDTIRIEAAEQQSDNSSSFYNHNSRLGGSKKQEWRYQTVRTDLVGSSLSAEEINLQSTGDMTIRASDVVATGDLNLISTGGNIATQSGIGQDYSTSFHSKKTTGISSKGFGVHVGSTKETTQQSSQGTYAYASSVGSLEGNVNISAAGGSYIQTGSDVLALKGDINVTAQDIAIVEARETRKDEYRYEYKQSGLTVSVNSPVISAIQTTQQMNDAAKRTGSDRSKALAVGASGLAIVNNAMTMDDAIQDMAAGKNPVSSGAIGISVSIGNSKTTSTSTNVSDTAKGSNLTAGGNINLTATGKSGEEQQNTDSGNILIQGSNIAAKNDVSPAAQNDIHILAARNTEDSNSSNKSSSSSLGVSFTSAGIGASISGSKGKGSGNSHDVYWTSSTVTAGNNLNITSGKDVNIIGSQVSGESVKADIGGNLYIESLQDTSTEHSSQSSKSGSLGFNFGPLGGPSASFNSSKTTGDGSYASVNDYAGIMAGDGGFDITVGGNTHLGGGVIASTQTAIKEGSNQLTTSTLTSENIDNESRYEVKGDSFGISGNMSKGKDGDSGNYGLPSLTPGIPIKGKDSDSDTSTTTSGISGGTIIITDEAKQEILTGKTAEETIEELNRDVITGELDENSLTKDWNLQELVDEMQAEMEITQEFINQGSQLVDNLDKMEAKAWEDKQAILDAGEINGVPLTDAQKLQLAMEIAQLKDDAIWGMGGIGRQIATAINAALSGNVGGASTDILQGAIVNYLQGEGAGLIKEFLNNYQGTDKEKEQLRGLLQGILACGGAAAGGSDCTSAALGAGGAVLINYLLQTDPEGMTAQQKQDRMNLVNSIIGGVTEALGGDSNAAVIAGKVEQENNYLTHAQETRRDQEMRACGGDSACRQAVWWQYAKLDWEQNAGFAVGMGTGVVISGKEAVEGVWALVTSPVQTYEAIQALINSEEARAQFGDAFLQDLKGRYDMLYHASQDEGFEAALVYGAESTRFATDLVAALLVVKGGAQIAGKLPQATQRLVNTAGKAIDDVAAGVKPPPSGGGGYIPPMTDAGKIFVIDGVTVTEIPSIGKGVSITDLPSKIVISNGMSAAESAQAGRIIAQSGGTFEGVPKLIQGESIVGGTVVPSTRYPAIDGWHHLAGGEKIPVSLKEVTGNSPQKILGEIREGVRVGADHNISNATMYMDARNMSADVVIDFANKGALTQSGRVLDQGVFNRIIVNTKDGFVTIEVGGARAGKPVGW
ncbi:tRNA nuclease CdiA-2 [Saezia sanguinis]|uniref:tRNA nuclease CdiA-2 n=1 Tax=Saezia sanguinis TaxID=1965230 RepID=A0A433SGB4_9BURK|nr:hemagglutinin repeat-containing protein [Saezia sanguinis]RUS67726.1 tRNA nuclease CdiA-2 [Saezia sanguinis]